MISCKVIDIVVKLLGRLPIAWLKLPVEEVD
jgi:hypothetical protein